MILQPNHIAESQHLLLDVFRDGYGDRYVGDENFLRGYILPAHVAIVDDRHEDINSAALLRNSRIIAAATRMDRERYGSRFQSLVGLFEVARIVDNEAWVGIGVTAKESVKAAAQQAGMTRSMDEPLLRTRLARSGKMDSYTIRPSSAGLLITLANSNNGPEYWQEVWDWGTEQSDQIHTPSHT